jgi:PAS domain-containing protein
MRTDLKKTEYQDYSLFHRFFEYFSGTGVAGIDSGNLFMVELDQLMERNNQLFYISDAILLDILFISKSVSAIFGIEPDKVSQGYFLTTTHPEDLNRHHLARAKLVSMAEELYIEKKGERTISITVRARRPNGSYFNALYQANLFYSKFPYESVFLILVLTDISWAGHIHKGFHFYCGPERSNFRFPDNELLMSGNIFSDTEFAIIKLIDEGLSSKEISEKLFRSIYTINTHRSNIIKKSEKPTMTEVINDLKANGLL